MTYNTCPYIDKRCGRHAQCTNCSGNPRYKNPNNPIYDFAITTIHHAAALADELNRDREEVLEEVRQMLFTLTEYR